VAGEGTDIEGAQLKTLTTNYCDVLPPLSTEEREALKASIKAEGVRVPICVDEDGNILDGKHRYSIDKNAPRQVIKGLTETEKFAFVYQANFARRNLSFSQKTDQRKKMKAIAKQLREDNPKKNTQKRVARLLGVSQPTISQWWDINTIESNNAYKPDARTKVTPEAKVVIVDRVNAGELQTQVAADYGITQPLVSMFVKQASKLEEQKAEREAAATYSREHNCEVTEPSRIVCFPLQVQICEPLKCRQFTQFFFIGLASDAFVDQVAATHVCPLPRTKTTRFQLSTIRRFAFSLYFRLCHTRMLRPHTPHPASG